MQEKKPSFGLRPKDGFVSCVGNIWPKNDSEKQSRKKYCFVKFLHAGDYFSLLHKNVQNLKLSNDITIFLHEGISKQIFLDHFLPSFLGKKLYFFDGKNNVRISQEGRVKTFDLDLCYDNMITQICREVWMLTFYENSLFFRNQ